MCFFTPFFHSTFFPSVSSAFFIRLYKHLLTVFFLLNNNYSLLEFIKQIKRLEIKMHLFMQTSILNFMPELNFDTFYHWVEKETYEKTELSISIIQHCRYEDYSRLPAIVFKIRISGLPHISPWPHHCSSFLVVFTSLCPSQVFHLSFSL